MSTRADHRQVKPARQPILLRYVALGALIGFVGCCAAGALGWLA